MAAVILERLSQSPRLHQHACNHGYTSKVRDEFPRDLKMRAEKKKTRKKKDEPVGQVRKSENVIRTHSEFGKHSAESRQYYRAMPFNFMLGHF